MQWQWQVVCRSRAECAALRAAAADIARYNINPSVDSHVNKRFVALCRGRKSAASTHVHTHSVTVNGVKNEHTDADCAGLFFDQLDEYLPVKPVIGVGSEKVANTTTTVKSFAVVPLSRGLRRSRLTISSIDITNTFAHALVQRGWTPELFTANCDRSASMFEGTAHDAVCSAVAAVLPSFAAAVCDAFYSTSAQSSVGFDLIFTTIIFAVLLVAGTLDRSVSPQVIKCATNSHITMNLWYRIAFVVVSVFICPLVPLCASFAGYLAWCEAVLITSEVSVSGSQPEQNLNDLTLSADHIASEADNSANANAARKSSRSTKNTVPDTESTEKIDVSRSRSRATGAIASTSSSSRSRSRSTSRAGAASKSTSTRTTNTFRSRRSKNPLAQ